MTDRRLTVIPIVHGQADLGDVGDALRRAVVAEAGADAWAERQAAIDQLWDAVEAFADGLVAANPAGLEGFKLYQDGLPVCGHETDIVHDLARKGSRNHAVLLRLMAAGAELVGTEDADLLVKEYELVRRAAEASGPDAPGLDPRHEQRQRAILERRDRFIARRIDATLEPGEQGVLFIGLLHDAAALIDAAPDRGPIDTQYPCGRPDELRRRASAA